MRYKYATRGIVLARAPVGEANILVTLLTSELGLVRARAQGLRKPGAKLAAALATFTESDCMLVRGKDGWRIAGALLEADWFAQLSHFSARERAARVTGLLLRLVAGEAQDSRLFLIMKAFLGALVTLPEDLHEAAEMLAVLCMLGALGLDTGDMPEGAIRFTPASLAALRERRASYIARINAGIVASGL